MKKKAISLLLAGILTFSMGTPVFATESEIADMQAQKQEAESNLAQTQSDISSMESKKQELESYLADLNTQYEELTNTISELSIQAGEKENQLKQIRAELKKAKKAEKKQYEDMKLRIQYMYENGGTSALETLLSSKDLAEFLNNAESVSKISQYDRNMLDKYVNLQNNIQEQETAAEEEKQSIDALLAERSSKKQEVQELTASTSDNIASYVDQISASQEEAAALTEQINNADNSIALLVQQAEEEKAAREAAEAKAAEEAAAQAEESNDAEESSSRMKTHPKIMLRILSSKTYQRILLMRNIQKKQTVATIPKMQIPVLIQKQHLRNRHLLRVLIPARGNTLETLH